MIFKLPFTPPHNGNHRATQRAVAGRSLTTLLMQHHEIFQAGRRKKAGNGHQIRRRSAWQRR